MRFSWVKKGFPGFHWFKELKEFNLKVFQCGFKKFQTVLKRVEIGCKMFLKCF